MVKFIQSLIIATSTLAFNGKVIKISKNTDKEVCAEGLEFDSLIQTCVVPVDPLKMSRQARKEFRRKLLKKWREGDIEDDENGEDKDYEDPDDSINICLSCPEDSTTCFLPADNPYQFVECANGQAFYLDCPTGLVWDQTIENCNWPEEQPSDDGDSDDGDSDEPENICNTCPDGSAQDWTCMFATENPNQFIECSNGEPVTKDCPPGLVYDSLLRVCNWPKEEPADNNDNSDDNDDSDGEIQNICDACTSNYACMLPTENPSQFVECSNGTPFTKNCPAGLVFDPKLKICNWP